MPIAATGCEKRAKDPVRNTHGNRLGEGPSQVGASFLGVEGKGGHRGQAASFRGGNRDQEGKVDELRKVVRDHLAKVKSKFDHLTHGHRTQEEGVHRTLQEGLDPWEARSCLVADQDAEDRNRNLREGVRCQIHRQP